MRRFNCCPDRDFAVALKYSDADHANHPGRSKCSRLCGSTGRDFCSAQVPFVAATGGKKKSPGGVEAADSCLIKQA